MEPSLIGQHLDSCIYIEHLRVPHRDALVFMFYQEPLMFGES